MSEEIERTNQFGFSKKSLTGYLICKGLLDKNEVITSWRINDNNFLELETEKEGKQGYERDKT